MTGDELEQAVCKAIVAHLADRVIAAMRAREKCAVVLLTGTDLGLTELANTLRTLRDDGWTLRFAVSTAAHRLIGAEQLAALGLPAQPASCDDRDALLDGCGMVLVPMLSITVAAKAAGMIRDSFASQLLADALERGMTVVAALDGACPDNPKRPAEQFQVNSAYKARMRANLQALNDYGVRLVPARKLVAAAQRGPAADTRAATPDAPASASPERRQNKRIFSRSDAVLCQAGELRLGRDVLVTPAAADELRNRNVRLTQA